MPILRVEISEEEYQQLKNWMQGQPVEAWLREALRAAVQRRAQSKARLQAFYDWIQRYASDETPAPPLESLRRENLYQEYDL
ncbi:MAG: hypothetical protein KatS3mg016_0515 [Fimbriimonadales bacterium]|nr:MAG: hypothetical protein KatS3mg016_0515 [Fimbriimonadales bacterium]